MQNFNYHTHTYRCGHAQKDMTDEDSCDVQRVCEMEIGVT